MSLKSVEKSKDEDLVIEDKDMYLRILEHKDFPRGQNTDSRVPVCDMPVINTVNISSLCRKIGAIHARNASPLFYAACTASNDRQDTAIYHVAVVKDCDTT